MTNRHFDCQLYFQVGERERERHVSIFAKRSNLKVILAHQSWVNWSNYQFIRDHASFIQLKFIHNTLTAGQTSAKWTLTYAIATLTECNIFLVGITYIVGRHYRKAQLINCSFISLNNGQMCSTICRASNIGKRLAKEIQLAISCRFTHLFV